MSDFRITFENPWLLLLLIPAFAITFIPHFMLAAKYRRTRNRIISMVLHLVITVLATTVFAGMRFEYKVANENNEIILLVDVSETQEQVKDERDEFVRTVLSQSRFDNYKVGVVTFGFNCKYAVPLTYDVDSIFDAYLSADLPDTSATNIENALVYATGLFKNPQSGKIVLVTDGLETDGKASAVIRTVRSSGVSVDVAEIPSSFDGGDVCIVGVEAPEYHIEAGTENTFTATITTDAQLQATLKIYDGEDELLTTVADLSAGTNYVNFDCVFAIEGVHDLIVEAQVGEDLFAENNIYHKYVNIEVFNKILVIEREEGEGDAITALLTETDEFTVDRAQAFDDEKMPSSIEQLRLYDQVVLCNIAHSDLPEGFSQLLLEYVRDYGGGVLTLGGDKDPHTAGSDANAYQRKDLYGTPLQKILPVNAINYTPPLGVMIIVDTSGSMSEHDNGSPFSRLEWAKEGVKAVLNATTERDWIGLMTLADDYNSIIEMTPRTKETTLRNAIEELDKATGGTVFPDAIDKAGTALSAFEGVVDKRHIIIITDGEVPPEQQEDYEAYIENNYRNGITLSVIMMNSGNQQAQSMMQQAVDKGHGTLYTIRNSEEIVKSIQKELSLPMITEVDYEPFNPTIANMSSPIVADLDRADGAMDKLDVSIDKFYGSKVKKDAELVLKGAYDVPIYAQWRYGKGMVGSLMLDGVTLADTFTSDATGRAFIRNAVANLMPTENIRPTEITINLRETNYTNNISVYATLEEGEYVSATVEEVFGDGKISLGEVKSEGRDEGLYSTSALGSENSYTRTSFVAKRGGIYKLTFEKTGADGTVVSSYETYKSFSYSAEYLKPSAEDLVVVKQNLADIAKNGGGTVIAGDDLEDPESIFKDFVTELERVVDPTMAFAIISIVLFLLDVCVRKFKFKWIHEIVRERKEKQNKAA